MSDRGAPSFALRFFMGIACAAGGVFPILAAFDVGPFRSDTINGPPWIGAVAGAVFLTGAMFLWFHDAATRRPWLGGVFAFLLIAAFAALGNWVAFGPGPRECSSTFSFAVFTSARWVSGLECRIAFGIGAMMCNGLLMMVASNGLTQAGVTNALPRWLDKFGTALLMLALAPILLVYLAAKVATDGARWWRARIGSTLK